MFSKTGHSIQIDHQPDGLRQESEYGRERTVRDIRVLIIGDHRLVNDALAERMEAEPGIVVVGTLFGDTDVVAVASHVHPDVSLLHCDPGRKCAFESARRIRRLMPKAGILFLTSAVRDHQIDRAIAVRANGMISTRVCGDVCVEAVRAAASGKTFYSSDVRSRIVMDEDGQALASTSRSRIMSLTAREIEVLCLIASGHPQKKIAVRMNISVKTVDKHTSNLMKKVEIHDRVELTRIAIREGLVDA